MKSKTRNVILISIAVVLLLIVVLCATVFTVKEVKLNFLDTYHTTTETQMLNDVNESGAISMGTSMFLLNKSKMTSAIESNVPYIRIIGLEAEFPNVLKINCVERKDCFSVRISNTSYAILDKYFKTLKITNASALPRINISDNSLEVGQFATGDDLVYYEMLVQAFDSVGTYENAINTYFDSIELVGTNDGYNFILINDDSNIIVNVKDVDIRLNDKIRKLISNWGLIANNKVINVYMHNNEVVIEEN